VGRHPQAAQPVHRCASAAAEDRDRCTAGRDAFDTASPIPVALPVTNATCPASSPFSTAIGMPMVYITRLAGCAALSASRVAASESGSSTFHEGISLSIARSSPRHAAWPDLDEALDPARAASAWNPSARRCAAPQTAALRVAGSAETFAITGQLRRGTSWRAAHRPARSRQTP
jgi:hypothetical protein